MSALFIVNPQSAGGATGRRMPEVERVVTAVFGPEAEIRATERAAHATEIAASAEHDLVVAIGGDGTANEVINGLARIPRESRPAFGVLPAGTGSDLVKSVGMPHEVRAAVEVLKHGERRPVDWMQLEIDGTSRVCVNVAGFGMQGAIVAAVNHGSKRFGGRVTFAVATAKVALGWRAPEVDVRWWSPEGEGSWNGKLASCFVGNGHHCGGGMFIGPDASMGDGLAEMTLIPEQSIPAAAFHARRLYDGTMSQAPGVQFARVSRLEARAVRGASVLVDVDGEQPGALPLILELVPNAVQMVGSWG